ncbi:MAG: hypothetical protein HeimAB125_06140 [Candidatus Heimdallarchaeota archaeon AB_125]|nr:MAG: hypothetical protein HeimAB125_06140 [Candidatus Heimdallarchaeota archaeon AB_125]
MSLEKFHSYSCLLTILLVIGFISSPMMNFQSNSFLIVDGFAEEAGLNSQLIQSDPVQIYNDSGFTIFPGSGTELDPYRLKFLNITSDTQSCGINISDTTKFFVIENCYINVKQIGIWISWIALGTAEISNNTITDQYTNGIDIWGAPGTVIDNNTITVNGLNGIKCIDSDEVKITNNVLSMNNDNGVSIRFCDDVVISNNYCEANRVGIEVFFGRNSIIEQNLCFENKEYGFYLWEISAGHIRQNNLSDNLGPAFYFKDSDNIQLEENEAINNSIGFYLEDSHSFNIFNNSISKDRNDGIYLFNSNENEISYNFLILNEGYGVVLNYSSNNLIRYNNFIDNNLGGLSQAYSKDGSDNYWFDEELEMGNFWNEWLGVGDYTIGGSWGEFDLYPLDDAVEIPRDLPEKPSWLFYFLVITLPVVCSGILTFFIIDIRKKRKTKFIRYTKKTSDYIDVKRKIAYSKDVGIGLFRFGMTGGEIINAELDTFNINMDEFIGFCYVTVGQGQRYETGVYGPLPAPSIIDHSMIIFAFWGKDDNQADPRFEGKQYYVISVVFPENKTQHLIKNDVMNTRFRTYIKKFKYPNRMSIEEMNFFREIVFI